MVFVLIIIFFIIISLAIAVLVRQGIEGETKLGNFSIQPITEPLVKLSRLPEKILKKTLKPNDLLIEDLWDEKRNFSRDKEVSMERQKKTNIYYFPVTVLKINNLLLN